MSGLKIPVPVSVAVGNRRLLKLADFLETVPRKQFRMAFWVGADWQGAPDLSCGTTACALGWATRVPSLRRLGLRLTRNEHDTGGYITLAGVPDVRHPFPHHPVDTHDTSLQAAERVFALDADEARYLFVSDADLSGGWDSSPEIVANKFREFVSRRTSLEPSAPPK